MNGDLRAEHYNFMRVDSNQSSTGLTPLVPCRVYVASAAPVKGVSNPAKWAALHSVLPYIGRSDADFGSLSSAGLADRHSPQWLEPAASMFRGAAWAL